MTNTCAKCGADNATSKCSLCKSRFYCGRDCQKADWGSHKKVCTGKAPAPASTATPTPASSTKSSVPQGCKNASEFYGKLDGKLKDAITNIMKNPSSVSDYASDPDIMAAFKEMERLMQEQANQPEVDERAEINKLKEQRRAQAAKQGPSDKKVFENAVSVLGVDLGTATSLVASFTQGEPAPALAVNGISEHESATMVGFAGRERLMGPDAQSRIKSNFSNTVRNLKNAIVEAAAINANYDGEEREFSPESTAAMLIGYLVECTKVEKAAEMEGHIALCCPDGSDEGVAKRLLDAARIAAPKATVRLLNESAAMGLSYWHGRSSDDEQNVLIVDVGAGCLTASVYRIDGTSVNLVNSKADRSLGVETVMSKMTQHVAEQIKAKKGGVNVLQGQRGTFRTRSEVEKLVQGLSSNDKGQVVLCVDDQDIILDVSRDEFNGVIADWCASVKGHVAKVTAAAGTVNVMEIVGGGSRIPAAVESIKGAAPSATVLHTLSDGAVAMGSSLYAAIASELDFGQALPTLNGATVVDSGALTGDAFSKAVQAEAAMRVTDEAVRLAGERKNELEEFVFSARSKVASDKVALLDEAEDWLYDEGENGTAEDYVKKLQELKMACNI